MKLELAIFTETVHQLCDCIFKETWLHSRRTDASDLLLIYKQTAACVILCINCKLCFQRCIRTYTVILSISHDHTSVQTAVSCLCCRHDLKLGRKEIILFNIILLFKDCKDICFYSILFFLFRILFLRYERTASDQYIEILSFDHNARFFLKLIACQMDQQVGYENYRIAVLFSDTDIDRCSVFLCHDSVNCQRHCHPLIFLYTAVIMCVKVNKFGILVQRFLFQIKTRRIDMCAENSHSLLKRISSDVKQRNCLSHKRSVHLVSSCKLFSGLDYLIQILITVLFCDAQCLLYALALRLSRVKKRAVADRKLF